VSVTDLVVMRNAVRTSAPAAVTSRFDHNRDGRVNVADMLVTRRNFFATLRPILEAPPVGQAATLLPASAPPASVSFVAASAAPPLPTSKKVLEEITVLVYSP
jgi:hypothetical protein